MLSNYQIGIVKQLINYKPQRVRRHNFTKKKNPFWMEAMIILQLLLAKWYIKVWDNINKDIYNYRGYLEENIKYASHIYNMQSCTFKFLIKLNLNTDWQIC